MDASGLGGRDGGQGVAELCPHTVPHCGHRAGLQLGFEGVTRWPRLFWGSVGGDGQEAANSWEPICGHWLWATMATIQEGHKEHLVPPLQPRRAGTGPATPMGEPPQLSKVCHHLFVRLLLSPSTDQGQRIPRATLWAEGGARSAAHPPRARPGARLRAALTYLFMPGRFPQKYRARCAADTSLASIMTGLD